MNEPIDELISYADHTQGCMVGAGHDECTCGYDDAEGKAQAAWDALKFELLKKKIDDRLSSSMYTALRGELRNAREENARLAAALLAVRALIWPVGSWATIGEAVPMVDNAIACIDAALSPQESPK